MSGAIVFFDLERSEYAPVVAAAVAAGHRAIINRAGLHQALEGARVPTQSWGAFTPPNLSTTTQERLSAITEGLSDALADPTVRSAFTSSFGSFLPVTGQAFFDLLTRLVEREITVIETFENLCLQEDVRLVVFGCDNNHAERALIGAARAKGIPTLQFEHAISHLQLSRVAGQTILAHSDIVAHFGERAHELLVRAGNDPARLVAIGAPRWDALYGGAARMPREQACRELDLDPQRPVVLFCTQYSEGTAAYFAAEWLRRYSIHRSLAQTVGALPGSVQLLVRPHPDELRAHQVDEARKDHLARAYQDWTREHGLSGARVVRDYKLESIRAADVVVVEDESCIIPEAMILERPVLIIPRFAGHRVYTERDGVLYAREEELPRVLGELLTRPELREATVSRQTEALPALNHANDGRATDRAAELVLRMARREEAPSRDVHLPSGVRSGPKVLFAYRSHGVDVEGGAAHCMRALGAALTELGARVECTLQVEPDASRFDLVHAFNAWHPEAALHQLRHLKRARKPLVWSPIYLHWCECAWSNPAVRAIFQASVGEADRKRYLDAMASGALEIEGKTRWLPNEMLPGFHENLREMLELVDHLCPTSHHEIRTLMQITRCIEKPFTLVPHGLDAAMLRDADPALFRARIGEGDFVLTVGAVDARKNQLMLIEALRGTGIKLVMIGPCTELDYLERCEQRGGDALMYLGRLSSAEVASAYKAARVHALPSFAEGAALVNLEAAVAECPMVVSNRSSEFEYFGDAPYYCDPSDVDAIRSATLRAWDQGRAQPQRWQTLAGQVAERFTWKRAAELTLKLYEDLLAAKSRSAS